MAATRNDTNAVPRHSASITGFYRPAEKLKPNDTATRRSIAQAEFDALPAWSVIENDPEYQSTDAFQPHHFAPPSYSTCMSPHMTSLLLSSNYAIENDEESQCGFWDEHVPSYDRVLTSFPAFRGRSVKRNTHKQSQTSIYALCCFCCAISIVVLAAMGFFLVLDLGAGQLGYGTGVAEHVIYGHTQAVSVKREMRFCLATPNRDVPTLQTWHFLAPNAKNDCRTEIVTMLAGPGDDWKLHTSDAILFGESDQGTEGKTDKNRFITVEERIRALELGDNVAEEGVLGQMI